ncbi:hypothetical protein PC9H_010727 [Pleurotus ostreatus]|uniref:Transcription factor CBF/NF-Y/archaeal histone domain-containing protein n=2 Tax=Pleurotus TaxID=5320 RepID=A0A8H6ZNC8_PLEOS|nr:uncharacterized protein PC9H_010727 [Pleurotus ostreatus]KAF7422571.1 hypothetical protein PC9H_010727 [Pleurotus ostreatus]KAG9227567.1 hypothetical protein CCMSSC00406_0000787 [Pleurotus cornucopiae]
MASPVLLLPSSDGFDFDDSEAEEGVDQLYSDTEDDGTTPKKSAVKSNRPVGDTILPQQRLENIIQNDGVTGSLALSKEALFLVSLAAEEFIKKLARAGRQQADAGRRNLILYRDMSMATQQYQEFMFLRDTIPCPISIVEALQLREAKELEAIEADPAMVGAPSVGPSAAPSIVAASATPSAVHSDDQSISFVPKASSKERTTTNGRSHNGSSSRYEERSSSLQIDDVSQRSASRTGSIDPVPAASSLRSRRPAGDERLSSKAPSPLPSSSRNNSVGLNGHSHTTTPAPAGEDGIKIKQQSPPYDPQRNGNNLLGPGQPPPLAGPASGFLQDTKGPFVRGGQIPGRTIYSQDRPPQ